MGSAATRSPYLGRHLHSTYAELLAHLLAIFNQARSRYQLGLLAQNILVHVAFQFHS